MSWPDEVTRVAIQLPGGRATVRHGFTGETIVSVFALDGEHMLGFGMSKSAGVVTLWPPADHHGPYRVVVVGCGPYMVVGR